MCLEVGVAMCESDVSCMSEEQTVCLNKLRQCNPFLSSSLQSYLAVVLYKQQMYVAE